MAENKKDKSRNRSRLMLVIFKLRAFWGKLNFLDLKLFNRFEIELRYQDYSRLKVHETICGIAIRSSFVYYSSNLQLHLLIPQAFCLISQISD